MSIDEITRWDTTRLFNEVNKTFQTASVLFLSNNFSYNERILMGPGAEKSR